MKKNNYIKTYDYEFETELLGLAVTVTGHFFTEEDHRGKTDIYEIIDIYHGDTCIDFEGIKEGYLADIEKEAFKQATEEYLS